MRQFDYKLIVIGGGPAGRAAANGAAKEIKKSEGKIAIVESGALGGATVSALDDPTRALLKATWKEKELAESGISGEMPLHYDDEKANWIRTAATRKEQEKAKAELAENKIVYYRGRAHFLNPYEIMVGDKKISAPRFIIATGSSVDTSELAGTDKTTVLTPATAYRLKQLPGTMAIIGAGSTGCEMAEYFASSGVKVLLIDAMEQILPREDTEISEWFQNYFTKKLGMKILTRAQAIKVEDGAVTVLINGRQHIISIDMVTLATGGKPNVGGLALENAKVRYSKNGISVDRGLETSSKHIWAAGDVIGGESSYIKACYEGVVAMTNAIKRAHGMVNYGGMIRTTWTSPEIAKVGMNERECQAARIRGIKKALTFGENGFIKMIADKSGVILGATIVASDAGLMAHEISLAVRYGMKVAELGTTPHEKTADFVKMAARGCGGWI